MNEQAMLPIQLVNDEYIVDGPIHPLWGTTHLNIMAVNEATAHLLQKAGRQTCLSPSGKTLKVYVPQMLLSKRDSILSVMVSREQHPGLYISYDADGDGQGVDPYEHVEEAEACDARTRITLAAADQWVEAEIPMEPLKRGEMVNVLFHTMAPGDTVVMAAVLSAAEQKDAQGNIIDTLTLCTILSNTPGITPLEHDLPPLHTAQVIRPAFGQARA